MIDATDDPLLDACREITSILDATTDDGEKIAAVAIVWLTPEGAKAALKKGEKLCPEDFPHVQS